MVQNGPKWSKMAQDGPKLSKIYKNGQNISKQCGTKILILEYIRIYLGKYIHSLKYLLIFSRTNLFGYSFVTYFSWRIYSDIHLFNIYGHKYIQIFIHALFLLTNIFRYSFVQQNYICYTLFWTSYKVTNRGADKRFPRPP